MASMDSKIIHMKTEPKEIGDFAEYFDEILTVTVCDYDPNLNKEADKGTYSLPIVLK